MANLEDYDLDMQARFKKQALANVHPTFESSALGSMTTLSAGHIVFLADAVCCALHLIHTDSDKAFTPYDN